MNKINTTWNQISIADIRWKILCSKDCHIKRDWEEPVRQDIPKIHQSDAMSIEEGSSIERVKIKRGEREEKMKEKLLTKEL